MPTLLILLALLSASATSYADSATDVGAPDFSRQRELVHLVRQDCGSCHGMTLQGGLGPSLKPEALRDKPVEALVATIYQGRPGTAMPPWRRFLSEAEARWIVEQLLAGFPTETLN
ncbi:cytochrome c [Accumulibacter sp.]|uniref:c-type cytochrome n=1 Tax=Accumulibacter sp. TaxID=2053492 RepID=UPI0025FC3C2E|nr:cytochrome c [Accumulibacter sp.]MCM8596174.1 cytochrome c [Accumulibacter sp.]MCM8625351.1 cytochrome c [Accumulibacter sp.]MDS4050323.1 cytochrome c [Accumulibacter sp.]